MKRKKTIESVVKAGFCTGCGTCVGICPFDALEMNIDVHKGIYLPKVDKAKCTECGLCFDVCPGHSIDSKSLNCEIFGKEPDDILIGNYLDCYIGYATDYNIRYNSASGGLVTAILISALEEGLIDGALVTRMSKENPLDPQPFIAKTRDEILYASKSKYCPVPANIALKVILQNDGRFAVVGLPCHLYGIRKAEHFNSELRRRIVLHLGIFCGHSPNLIATEFLLKHTGIAKKEVTALYYRGKGWPGGMSIELRNGTKKFLPHSYCWSKVLGNVLFVPQYCLLCGDGTAELSDISFGDAWLPELKTDNIGQSVIIARNEVGKRILLDSAMKQKIKLSDITSGKVIQSQMKMLCFKKVTLRARMAIFKLFGNNVPNNKLNLLKPKFMAYPAALLTLLSKKYLSKCLLLNYHISRKYIRYLNILNHNNYSLLDVLKRIFDKFFVYLSKK